MCCWWHRESCDPLEAGSGCEVLLCSISQEWGHMWPYVHHDCHTSVMSAACCRPQSIAALDDCGVELEEAVGKGCRSDPGVPSCLPASITVFAPPRHFSNVSFSCLQPSGPYQTVSELACLFWCAELYGIRNLGEGCLCTCCTTAVKH